MKGLVISDQARPVLEHILSGEGVVGVGIPGMDERIKQLGGRLEITSGEHGTTVRARLPLVKDAG